MNADQARAICTLLRYIQKQPNAKHNAEGIAKYWIFQQRLEEQVDIALNAIDFLVDEGFLQAIEQSDGGHYYRVNPVRLSDIHKTLNDLGEVGPDAEILPFSRLG